jgi:hypothetical protein
MWLLACGGGDPGAVAIGAWGEDALVDGLVTDDGWAISFSAWGVGLSSAGVYDPADDTPIAVTEGVVVLDLVGAEAPVALDVVSAAEGRWDFGFSTAPPTSGEGELATRMAAEGLSQLVVGEASRGEEVVPFEFGFQNPATYSRCENGADGTQGIAVASGAEAEAVIYLHAEHLVLMALGVEEASQGFDALAAAAPEEGPLTLADLAAVDPAVVGYESAGLELDSLDAFLSFSLAQSLHLNGEGLCQIRAN